MKTPLSLADAYAEKQRSQGFNCVFITGIGRAFGPPAAMDKEGKTEKRDRRAAFMVEALGSRVWFRGATAGYRRLPQPTVPYRRLLRVVWRRKGLSVAGGGGSSWQGSGKRDARRARRQGCLRHVRGMWFCASESQQRCHPASRMFGLLEFGLFAVPLSEK